mmetsp:Transcript_17609/g.50702  ORF Transcript_17609/g.50702 Transcript_17609/m.50702 type:complete len:127 (+) Transcript_17609:15-395(+)
MLEKSFISRMKILASWTVGVPCPVDWWIFQYRMTTSCWWPTESSWPFLKPWQSKTPAVHDPLEAAYSGPRCFLLPSRQQKLQEMVKRLWLWLRMTKTVTVTSEPEPLYMTWKMGARISQYLKEVHL